MAMISCITSLLPFDLANRRMIFLPPELKTLVAEAERLRFSMPVHVAPAELIKMLMEEQGLKQSDLAEDFGGKSYVSEFLSGRRPLSKEVAARLCKRFSLRPEALLPEFQR